MNFSQRSSLEESLIKKYESGFSFLNEINLSIPVDDFLDHPQEISKRPARWIYDAILEFGKDDVMASWIPWINDDQWRRLGDYDLWEKDELCLSKALSWLVWVDDHESPQEVLRKISQWDEELILALFGPYIRTVDRKEFESLGDEEQDLFVRVPGGTYFYAIVNTSLENRKILEDIFEKLWDFNPEYASSLILHCAWSPPGESLLLARQFRKARLEEDGFLPKDEALLWFSPRELDKEFKCDYHPSTHVGEPYSCEVHTEEFAYVMSGLMVATDCEVGDRKGVRQLAGFLKAQSFLGWQWQGETTSLKVQWQWGWSLVYRQQEIFLKTLNSWGFPGGHGLVKAHQSRRFGTLGALWDRHGQSFGFEDLQKLKLGTGRLACQLLEGEWQPIGSLMELEGLTKFWLDCLLLYKLAEAFPKAQEEDYRRRLQLYPLEAIEKVWETLDIPLPWGMKKPKTFLKRIFNEQKLHS